MFRRGSRIKLCISTSSEHRYFEGKIKYNNPLRIIVSPEDVEHFKPSISGKLLVDVRDPRLNETIMTLSIEKVTEDNVLHVKRLGQHEARQFVRMNAWLDFSFRVLEQDEEDVPLEAIQDIDFGEPLKQMSHSDMRILSRTEEASEAMLYLIQAIYALDRKLEAIATMHKEILGKKKTEEIKRKKINISGSGIRFASNQPIEQGKRIKVRFRLTAPRPHEVQCICEAVRVDPLEPVSEEGLGYGIACKFVDIRPSDQEHIVSFAIQKQREALRRLNDINQL